MKEINLWRFLALLLLLLFLWQWNCKGGKKYPEYTETRTETLDTSWKKKADSSAWDNNPKPVNEKAGKPKYIYVQVPVAGQPGEFRIDTVVQPVDTAAILRDYTATRDYEQVYDFEYGEVKVQNSVAENKLQKQRVLPTFNIPEVTKTITVTQTAERKGQVFLGFEAFGSKGQLLSGLGTELEYLTKKEKGYKVKAMFLNGQLYYGAGIKFPLFKN